MGDNIQVVDEGSATLNKTKETVLGLDANHSTMCKFGTKNSLYRKVLTRLTAEISSIGTKVGEEEHEARLKRLLELVPEVPETEPMGV